jgi:serralysin
MMATPVPRSFGLTGDRVIDGMTTGYYWALNTDRTVDWSISDGFSGEHWNSPASLQANIASMLAQFSYFANIRFNYVGYYQDPEYAGRAGSELNVFLDAHLLFSSSRVWGMAFFPDPSIPLMRAGDVVLNVNGPANTLSSYAPGSAGWFFYLHEIGHALGLKHPHDSGGNGRPTLAQLGLQAFDVDEPPRLSWRPVGVSQTGIVC